MQRKVTKLRTHIRDIIIPTDVPSFLLDGATFRVHSTFRTCFSLNFMTNKDESDDDDKDDDDEVDEDDDDDDDDELNSLLFEHLILDLLNHFLQML